MPASHLDRLVAGVRTALDPVARSDRELLDRFLANRDAAAFEALVRRHGPTVLAVCQRVLSGPDADDAFQATFVALARDARRVRTAVGGWLVVVAHRVAVRLRAAERRRQAVEARHRRPTDDRDPSWRDACAVLHQELDRLPEAYRRPLVLCYLRGMARDEAARELGCTVGVLKGNLERGRSRLRTRLSRRGLTLSTGLLGSLATVTSAVPPSLIRAVLKQRPSTAATEIVRSLRPTGVTWKAASLLTLAAGVLVVIAAGDPTKPAHAGQPSPPPAPVAKAAAKPDVPMQTVAVALKGQVVGPEGKPVAGAALTIVDGAGSRAAPQPSTNADGTFAFTLDPPIISFHTRFVVARAPKLGCDWAEVPAFPADREVTLRLPDDVPVTGRVLDLEGKPVPGASIRVEMIEGPEPGKCDAFLKAWAGTRNEHEQSAYLLTRRLYDNPGLKDLFGATTDAAGRFTLSGIGKDRVPVLVVSAPGLALQSVRVLTRQGYTDAARGKYRMSGPDCIITVGPAKPVSGVVRDIKAKKPLAGVRVVAEVNNESAFLRRSLKVESTTDADGKYTLTGLPKTKRQVVLVDPKAGHLHHFAELIDTAGFEPIGHDVELTPGVVVTGRVTDKDSGRPVRARIWYRPLQDNALEDTVPGYAYVNFGPWGHGDDALTDTDGRYTLTALPGPGLLHLQAWDGSSVKCYPEARLDSADEKRGAYWRPFKEMPGFVTFKTGGRGGGYGPEQLNAYRVIDLKPTDTKTTADFTLWPGVSRKLRLVDPDGKPPSGVDCHGLAPMGDNWSGPGPEVTAIALDPTRARKLLFRHADRKLTAIVAIRGDEPEPVVVKLVPCGAIIGRVLDAAGKPVAGATVEPSYQDHPIGTLLNTEKLFGQPGELPKTDAEGRFRFDDIPAGIKVRLTARRVRDDYWYSPTMTLEPGQVKDLGDWKRE